MTRLVFATTLLLAVCSLVAAATPIPKTPPEPLPKGATARLGSLAFRGPRTYGLWYSTDGKTLYAWDHEKMIGWDAATGRRLERGPFPLGQKFRGYHPVYAGDRLISFEQKYSNDGSNRLLSRTAVVTGPDGKVISRVDCSSRALGNVSPTAPRRFAVSRDGTRAAHVADDRTMRAFDLNTGKEIFKKQLAAERLAGVILAPDGRTLFVQEVSKSVRRFSLADGKELTPLTIDEGQLSALVISPDGKLAVSQVSIWEKSPKGVTAINPQSFVVIHDLATGKAVGKIEPGGRPSCGPMIGSEAILVVSRTFRPPASQTAAIARWNLKTLKKEWEIQDEGQLVLSPDGKQLALSAAGIRIFDAATGKRLDTTIAHPHPIKWIGFSADGATVTTRCRAARMTWTVSGERKSVADGPELWDGRPYLTSPLVWFEIATDGKSVELAGGHFDSRKDGWRMPLGADVPERPLTLDGKRVFGAVFDARQARWSVTVYDGPAGKKIATWTVPAQPGQAHPAMVLSGDGKTLFGFDGDVVGRDPLTGKEKGRVKTGPVTTPHGAFPSQVAATADGSRIAVVQQARGARSSTLRVFEVKTGKELATHDIGRAYNPAILFNPTGSRVAVLNVEGGVLVCDAEGQAQPRKLVAASAQPTCAAFSPNNASLVVGYRDGTALVWDLTAK